MKKFATLILGLALIAGLTSCRQKRSKSDSVGTAKSHSSKKSTLHAKTDASDEPKVEHHKDPAPEARDLASTAAEIMMRADHDDVGVEVEHILIAFKGSMRSTATRSKAEAKALAWKIFNEITDEASFDALKIQHTDDGGQKTADGTYRMHDVANGGTAADGRFARHQMAKAFGDVSWKLKVGEVGITDYDNQSPFGYHIIRRVK